MVADSRFPRDGRFLEVIGTYDPLAKDKGIRLDTDKMNDWLGKGAQATDTVKDLLRKFKAAASLS